MNEAQQGGDDAHGRQSDIHPHDEVVVDVDVLDDVDGQQVVKLSQQVAQHPDYVHRQRAG